MLVRPLPLLNFFVFLVMLSIGLRVSGGDLLEVLRNRALFMRTLLANCVLIPGVGFLLVKLFPLTPDSTVGILLLASIPGTPDCPAIHPHGKNAVGVRRCNDLRVIGGEHRANTSGCRGDASNCAAQ